MADSRDWGVALAGGGSVLAVLLGLAGCSRGAGGPAPAVMTAPDDGQLINAAYGASDSRHLELAISSCNRDPQTVVEESGSEIRVTVCLAGVDSGHDCQDSVKVELAAPLDERRIIDAVSGATVPVLPAE